MECTPPQNNIKTKRMPFLSENTLQHWRGWARMNTTCQVFKLRTQWKSCLMQGPKLDWQHRVCQLVDKLANYKSTVCVCNVKVGSVKPPRKIAVILGSASGIPPLAKNIPRISIPQSWWISHEITYHLVIWHSHGKLPIYRWFTWVYLSKMLIFHGYVK